MTRDELFNRLKAVLVEEFELADAEVTPEAKLFTDLGLDSIDAVDLIVKMKPYIPGKINAEAFKQVKTVQDVVEVIFPLL
jgi:acyl carrier protein